MKKILLRVVFSFLIFHSSFFVADAQWVSIPDTNFGTWLNTNGYSACLLGNNSVGWQMDTSCPAVVNATSVACSHLNIRNITGIQYFDSLKYLNCSYDSISSLPPLHTPLTTLHCEVNQLSGLPSLPSTLTSLYCEINLLTSLPAIPSSLTRLDCYYNSLATLPFLPWTMTYLDCNHNLLSTLPNIPTALTTLWCHFNQLNNLPLPSSLYDLRCGNNPLNNLASLPASLRYIDCRYDQLSTLPVLPGSLISLNCNNNLLSSLPILPASLSILECVSNQLSTLPTLPTFLTYLNCSSNQLNALPALPINLHEFYCGYNQLSSMPSLPALLSRFYCNNNLLNTLPALPDSMSYCIVNDNPIVCLPQLKRIVNFNISNTNITCLPNYGNVTTSTPPLKFFPLCDPFNSNGCSVVWNIAGNVYYDANTNCIKNATDTAQRNIKVQLRSGGNLVQQALTGGEGFYSFDVDSFTTYDVSIDTTNISFRVSCPANNLLHDTITAIDSLDYSKDFALKCKTGFDLTAWSISGWRFRPANFTTVNIHAGDITNFYGVHCAVGVSGSVTVTINGSATYISPAGGALTPNVSGNVLTYNIADFGNVNFFSDFNIIVQTDTNAVIGSQVCFTVSITPTIGDNNPANNTLTYCFTVLASCDPNNKEVYPAGNTDTSQHWLTYTVNFQNTGTDTAQHIYVTDTLDSDLDYSSFQLLAYSHQPLVQIKENVVRFNFPNINLPDSNTNEPLSHGYVQYKIKLKDNLPIGTQINNTAYIYFDFNAPVVTNTTSNTISLATAIQPTNSLKGEPLRIYPNPASNSVTISIDESMIGSIATVSDVTGRKMAAVQLSTVNRQLSTADFGNGVYFVTVSNGAGSATKKLVISK